MNPIRVLLLEDDSRLRSALEEVLTLEGYEVVSAADGAEAVEKAEDFRFELLVFDVKLPGPDGLEVLARFKEVNPDLPSIVITGYASEADALRALRLGVGEYLEKPFNTDVLLAAVKRMERAVHQLRRTSSEHESFLRVLLWSLNYLNKNASRNESSLVVSPEEAGQVALRAALEAGFDEVTGLELQAAVLVNVARRIPSVQDDIDELSCYIPESVQQTCDSFQNGEEKRGLLQIGSLCSGLPFDRSLWSEIRPYLKSADAAPARIQEKHRRHLLSLGKGLAVTGDMIGARAAFERVLLSAPPRERGLALVELGRLSWKGGKNEEAVPYLKEVVNLVPELGPQTASELELEAAHLALNIGLEQGRILLTRAKKRLQRLGADGLTSQIELAEGLLSSLPVDRLTLLAEACISQPRLTFLTAGAGWVLPLFCRLDLKSEESVDVLKVLASRIGQAAPQAVSHLLQTEKNEEELVILLRLLQNEGLRQQGQVLQRLVDSSLGRASALARKLLEEKRTNKGRVRVFSLGQVEIRLDDATIPAEYWRTSRSRHVLARLIQSSRKVVAQDVLIEEFWPGMPPERGRRNLVQTLSDLRRAFRLAEYAGAEELIVREQETVGISEELAPWHDLDAFQACTSKANQKQVQGDLRAAIRHYQDALLLVRGGFMEDCKLAWSDEPRRAFERDLLQCLERLGLCCQEVGLFPELEEVALRILLEDSCHQVAHRLLMEAYLGQERPEQAVRHFEKAKSTLRHELGLEPHTELIRAYQLAKLAL